jgi:glycosyltransferase involved in cell wall biosynthesis
LKILILSHAQYITVALPKVIEFAETLSELGHEITLMATHKRNKFKAESFTHNGVHYLLSPSILPGKLRHGADFYDAIRRMLLLKNQEFDIIHAIDSRPSVIIPALYTKRKYNIPLVLEWSDWFGEGGTISERSSKFYSLTVGRIESFFEVGFRMKADGATVISQLLYERLSNMGYDTAKIHMHRMGGRLDRFEGFDKENSRELLKIPRKDIIFSYFGRILPNDHQYILDIFENFRFRTDKDACLYFIGSVQPLQDNLPSYIQYKGIVSNEVYNHYLSATDVCLLPMKLTLANKARWPSKFVDYLAAGKPVVATPVSDFQEIFKEVNIGILCKGDSIEEFTDSLLEILEQKSNWKLMGSNGKFYASNNLSWNIITSRIIKFYQKIITGITVQL